MRQVVVVGLDMAKFAFQVHGVDRDDAVVVRRRLRRSLVLPFFARIEPCRIGIEAYATGMRGAAMSGSRQRRCVHDQRDRPTLGPNAGRKSSKDRIGARSTPLPMRQRFPAAPEARNLTVSDCFLGNAV